MAITDLSSKTAADALAALDVAVAERGEDYNYLANFDRCMNITADGAPACIAGHVYVQWGVTANMLASAHCADASVTYVARETNMAPEVARVLSAAQRAQDATAIEGGSAYTWGAARGAAKD